MCHRLHSSFTDGARYGRLKLFIKLKPRHFAVPIAMREYPPKSQKTWNEKKMDAKSRLVPLWLETLLYTASTYGATLPAMHSFIKNPHIIIFNPSMNLAPSKECLTWNCGKRFLALSIGPASNGGKKETNKAYVKKLFSGRMFLR